MKTKKTNMNWTGRGRRKLLPFVGLLAALLVGATGCATVYRTSQGSLDGVDYKGVNGSPSETVYVTATGYYFLWSLPLASGDLRWNEQTKSINGGTCFFRDMVGATEIQNALLKMAETRNCDLVDMAFHDSDSSYAGASYGGIIGAFFGSSQIGASGVLVPRAPKATEGGQK